MTASKGNTDRQKFLVKCAKDSIKNKKKSAGKKAEFLKTILGLTEKSKKTYNIEKWVDAFITIELEIVNGEDGSECFVIRKIKMKNENNINQDAKEYYLEPEEDSNGQQFFDETFVEGNFFKQNIAENISTYDLEKGKKVSSSLCMDTISEFWNNMFMICMRSSWIERDVSSQSINDKLSTRMTAGVMFVELWAIKEIIRVMFWQKKHDQIRFFTSNKNSYSSLKAIVPEEHTSKSIVSVFTLLEYDDIPHHFQCFIFDPFVGEDTSAFINGLKDFMSSIPDEVFGISSSTSSNN